MTKTVKVTKKVNVKASSYWKGGKNHTRKAHKRIITVDKKRITKAQYKKKFNQRSAKSRKRDKSRTAHKSLLTGDVNFVSPTKNTDTLDWMGVDATGYKRATKGSKTKTLHKGVPAGYQIDKITSDNKKRTPKFRPKFNGKPIGPTAFNQSLNDAKIHIKTHQGRADGSIRNRTQQERFNQMENELWKGESESDIAMGDTDFFDKSMLDSSLEYGEKIRDYKKRFNMSNQDNYNRL